MGFSMRFKKDFDVHPYADCYPMISGESWREFVESIMQSKGPIQPLILWKDEDRGKLWLVDGRNRFKACKDASINLDESHVRYMQFNNDEEVRSFIIQVNNDRRQMSKQQRTAVALDMMEVQKELGKQRMIEKGREGGLNKGKKLDGKGLQNFANPSSHDSRDIVAQELGVNRGEIMQAKIIQDKGARETFEAYKQGIASTNALKLISELPEEEQIEVVNEGAKAIKRKASEIRAKKKQPSQELPELTEPLEVLGIVRGVKPSGMSIKYLTTVNGKLYRLKVGVPNYACEKILDHLRTHEWFEEADPSPPWN